MNQPRILAIVPARSKSKGLPDKNSLPFQGKPLLAHAVEIGVQSPCVTDTYISTDSADYEALAKAAGAKSAGLRSTDLSNDTAKTIDVVLDLIERLETQGQVYDYVLLLQPTAPQRQVEQVKELLALVEADKNTQAVVSVTRHEEPHPYKLKSIDESGGLQGFLNEGDSEVPRQLMPAVYKLTGAYYLNTVESLKTFRTFLPKGRTKAFVTKDIVNIDSQDDYDFLCWKEQG